MTHKVIISSQTLEYIQSYKRLIQQNGLHYVGQLFKEKLLNINLADISDADFLNLLIQTKKPQIFAEQKNLFEDWNQEELKILGDVGMQVPVTIFDNGHHDNPTIHDTEFQGTLLYSPAALLAGCASDLAEILKHNRFNDDNYYQLNERRLLPLLVQANNDAKIKEKKALITIPGMGCGQFAGKYKGILEAKLQQTLEKLLQQHGEKLQNISAIYYDPYEKTNIDNISTHHNIKLITKSSKNKGIPQLCKPASYGKEYQNCELYSVVAWDHVSWPGNDFWVGKRSTDDGVKAAASNSMATITGTQGKYNKSLNKYLPPSQYSSWDNLVTKQHLTLDVKGKIFVIDQNGKTTQLDHKPTQSHTLNSTGHQYTPRDKVISNRSGVRGFISGRGDPNDYYNKGYNHLKHGDVYLHIDNDLAKYTSNKPTHDSLHITQRDLHKMQQSVEVFYDKDQLTQLTQTLRGTKPTIDHIISDLISLKSNPLAAKKHNKYYMSFLEKAAAHIAISVSDVPKFFDLNDDKKLTLPTQDDRTTRYSFVSCPFPRFDSINSPDYHAFCDNHQIAPNKKPALQDKYDQIINLMLITAESKGHDLSIVMPNAFLRKLSDDTQIEVKEMIINSINKLLPQHPHTTLFIAGVPPILSSSLQNTKNNVVINQKDHTEPNRLYHRTKPVMSATMPHPCHQWGNGAWSNSATQAAEEGLFTRFPMLQAALNSNYNDKILQNFKAIPSSPTPNPEQQHPDKIKDNTAQKTSRTKLNTPTNNITLPEQISGIAILTGIGLFVAGIFTSTILAAIGGAITLTSTGGLLIMHNNKTHEPTKEISTTYLKTMNITTDHVEKLTKSKETQHQQHRQ